MVVVNNNSNEKQLDMTRFNEMDIIGKSAKNIVSKDKIKVDNNMIFPAKTVSIYEILIDK